MERWNWFLSYNFAGKWIMTDGYAEVTKAGNTLQATLRISTDTDPYLFVECIHESSGQINAHAKSMDPQTPPYDLRGTSVTWNDRFENKIISMILSDGQTVIGLANGPRSDEKNLTD